MFSRDRLVKYVLNYWSILGNKGSISKVIIKITISSIVIGLKKKLLFPTNSLAKLLSDSSTNQSHLKL